MHRVPQSECAMQFSSERSATGVFLYQVRIMVGSYLLHTNPTLCRYVRGLERRVSELEEQLAKIEAPSASSNASNTGNAPQEDCRIKYQKPPLSTKTPAAPESYVVSTQWAMSNGPHAIRPRRSTSLVDGLKMLSLEATAERHVGPSSGVAFAKLTQAMLRRLAPDQEAFVFGDEEEGSSGAGVRDPELLPSFEGTLDFLDLDMMLDSPQQLTSLSIDPLRQGSEIQLDLAQLEAGHIRFLLDFYFAHSHTLYPIIQQRKFVETLWTAYKDPFKALVLSPVWQFRIWMVLAIGSTTYCSVSLMDEAESIQLFNKAMSYFDAAMGCGEQVRAFWTSMLGFAHPLQAALEVLMLQVSYSFFNSAGPSKLAFVVLPQGPKSLISVDTWFLVGVAARIAIGMGLHTREVYETLAPDAADYQKRLFFSLYMMDRYASRLVYWHISC